MSLGSEPGSIVFSSGFKYSAQTIDLDTTSYEVPIWRLKTRAGTSRTPKGIIPVRYAYDSLLEALTPEPASAREWSESSFHPPGSTAERAMTVHMGDDSVLAQFFSSVPIYSV